MKPEFYVVRSLLETEAEYLMLGGDDASKIVAALAWLDSQPEAPHERWEPVEPDGDAIATDEPDTRIWVERRGVIVIEDTRHNAMITATLPDALRLCRRVEVTP